MTKARKIKIVIGAILAAPVFLASFYFVWDGMMSPMAISSVMPPGSFVELSGSYTDYTNPTGRDCPQGWSIGGIIDEDPGSLGSRIRAWNAGTMGLGIHPYVEGTGVAWILAICNK